MAEQPTISRARAEEIARVVVKHKLAVVFSFNITDDPTAGKKGPKDWNKAKPLHSEPGSLTAQIEHHYGKKNLLVVTEPSGVVTIDCDGPTGLEFFHSLELPKTLTVQSGRADGGRHYIFRPPAEGLEFSFFELGGNGTLEVGRVRTKLHVLAGVHPTGREYAFVRENGSDIATLPQEAYDRLLELAGAKKKKAREGLTEGERVGPSGRHDHLLYRSGQLWNIGLRGQALHDALRAVYENECERDPEKDAGIEEEIAGVVDYAHADFEEATDEPASEPLEWNGDLGALLTDTCELIRKYVVLRKHARHNRYTWLAVAALWPFIDQNGEARVTTQMLTDATGQTYEALRKAFLIAEAAGLLEIEQERRPGTALFKPNLYRAIIPGAPKRRSVERLVNEVLAGIDANGNGVPDPDWKEPTW